MSRTRSPIIAIPSRIDSGALIEPPPREDARVSLGAAETPAEMFDSCGFTSIAELH